MLDFDLEQIDEYFKGLEWNQLISEWKAVVLAYQEKKQFEEFEADYIIKQIISCSVYEEKEISSKELYDAFKDSIKSNHWNDYRIFSSRIDPDKKIERRYEIKNSSILSDYITICKKFFNLLGLIYYQNPERGSERFSRIRPFLYFLVFFWRLNPYNFLTMLSVCFSELGDSTSCRNMEYMIDYRTN